MTDLQPPKTTGTLCNVQVQAGLVAYPCTLIQGHLDNDEEPHYAVEVRRSVLAWQKWKREHPDPPEAHEHQWVLSEDDPDLAVCEEPGCNETQRIAHSEGSVASFDEIGDGTVTLTNGDTLEREITVNIDSGQVLSESSRVIPSRTRAGDQRLPDAPQRRRDDQTALIEFIGRRREVGIERYGQSHRPFNGRNTLQDLLEELVDGGVYATALLRVRTATRDDLRDVVLAEIKKGGYTDEELADRLADRLADWATLVKESQDG